MSDDEKMKMTEGTLPGSPKIKLPLPPTAAPPSAAFVIPKRDGLAEYGLYVEVIRYWRSSGKMTQHVKLFLAETTLTTYKRKAGTKQARWRVKPYPNHDAARAALLAQLGQLQTTTTATEYRWHPLLVQLTAADLDQVRAGEPPFGRYAGQHHVDKILGKLDDVAWKPAPDGHAPPWAAAAATGSGAFAASIGAGPSAGFRPGGVIAPPKPTTLPPGTVIHTTPPHPASPAAGTPGPTGLASVPLDDVAEAMESLTVGDVGEVLERIVDEALGGHVHEPASEAKPDPGPKTVTGAAKVKIDLTKIKPDPHAELLTADGHKPEVGMRVIAGKHGLRGTVQSVSVSKKDPTVGWVKVSFDGSDDVKWVTLPTVTVVSLPGSTEVL